MTTRHIEEHHLPVSSMGNFRTLKIIRYGNRSGGGKAYIQAGMHADEAPSYLVMHYLMDKLDQADTKSEITGEIVLAPVANPIGAGQWREDFLQGRFDFYNNINFNRDHPDLADRIADLIEGRLRDTAEENIALIRETTGSVLHSITPADESGHLKHLLFSLSHDADIVLDLHCDYQSVMHLYLGASLWPNARDLSAQLGAEITLLADDSGGTPFDEASSRLWWKLAERFPDHPIPPACLAATVELRGMADVEHELAVKDAENLFTFLQRRGLIKGRAPAPPALIGEATPLAAVERIASAGPGVVVFNKEPGQWVKKGEVVAEVVNPLIDAFEDRVNTITSSTDGLLFSRSYDRFARPGRIIAQIAGKKILKAEGENLLTM